MDPQSEKAAKEAEEMAFQELLQKPLPGFEKLMSFAAIRTNTKSLRVVLGLKSNLIEDDLWLQILKNHQKQFIETRRRILGATESFPERLRVSLSEGIKRGELPITQEKVDQIFKTLVLEPQDGLRHTFEKNDGSYHSTSHTIHIGSAILDRSDAEEYLFETYAHENFHALSGRTLVEQEEFYDEEDSGRKSYEGIRLGLRIAGRFKWLNEAITETLAMKYSTGKDKNVYSKERKLVNILMQRFNIPMSSLLAAYFEDYEPRDRDKGSGPISAWKQLSKELREKTGENLLLVVDKEIQAKGIDAVIKEYQET